MSRCTKCGAGYHLRCIDSELKLGACPFCHRHVGNEPIITKKYRDFAPDSRFGGVDSFVILTENDLEGGSGAAFLNTKMQKPKILSSPRGSANSLKTRSSSGKTLRASLPKLPFSPSLEKEDKERDSCPTVTRSGRSVKRKAIFDATAEAEQHLRSPRVGDQGKKARPIAGSEPKKNKVAMECRANDGNASTEETRGYPEHGGKTNCDFPHSSQHVCRHKISASVNLCPNFAQKCEHRGDGNSCSILQHFENSTSNIWSDGKNYGTNDACSSPPSNVFIDSVNSSPFTSIKFDKPAHSLATTCEAPLMAPSDSANDKVIRDMSIKPMAVANKNETGMNDSSNNRRPCQIVEDRAAEPQTASPSVHATSTKTNLHLDSALSVGSNSLGSQPKAPRRKPGARECMQISRRFHTNVIPEKYMNILMVSAFLIL